MKLKSHYLFIVFLFSLCSACDSSKKNSNSHQNRALIQGKTMGTNYHVIIPTDKDTSIEKTQLKEKIDDLLIKLNNKVSTYISSSEINQFNQTESTEWVTVDSELFSIVQAAQKISKLSNGAFDITLSPLIDSWGFGAKNTDTTPNAEQIKSALQQIGFQNLELDTENRSLKKSFSNLRIDLSAIAKGYAVDKISNFLNEKGYNNHLVEIGGELKASGLNHKKEKWRIAVEQPDLTINIAKNGLEISNRAVATSGDYRNYFIEKGTRRSHIISPKTGYPIEHKLASVTVLHDSTMLADAYATAILVLGEDLGKDFVQNNNLDVLMVIRKDDKFVFWSSSNVFN